MLFFLWIMNQAVDKVSSFFIILVFVVDFQVNIWYNWYINILWQRCLIFFKKSNHAILKDRNWICLLGTVSPWKWSFKKGNWKLHNSIATRGVQSRPQGALPLLFARRYRLRGTRVGDRHYTRNRFDTRRRRRSDQHCAGQAFGNKKAPLINVSGRLISKWDSTYRRRRTKRCMEINQRRKEKI